MIIANPSLSDAAVLTASGNATGAPVTNLQRIQPTDFWRSLITTPFIQADLGTSTYINLVALFFTNCTNSCTWRIRCADTSADLTASPGYDSGSITFHPWQTNDTRRHGFHILPGVTYRWVRIDISDPTNPYGYFDAGRLYISNSYTPTGSYRYGAKVGFIDNSAIDTTTGGNMIVNRAPIINACSFDLNLTSEAEFYANAYQIQKQRAASRDVAVFLDPNDTVYGHDKIYYGLLSSTLQAVHETYKLYMQRYEITGMI